MSTTSDDEQCLIGAAMWAAAPMADVEDLLVTWQAQCSHKAIQTVLKRNLRPDPHIVHREACRDLSPRKQAELGPWLFTGYQVTCGPQVDYYLELVREAAYRRRVKEAGERLAQAADSLDTDELRQVVTAEFKVVAA